MMNHDCTIIIFIIIYYNCYSNNNNYNSLKGVWKCPISVRQSNAHIAGCTCLCLVGCGPEIGLCSLMMSSLCDDCTLHKWSNWMQRYPSEVSPKSSELWLRYSGLSKPISASRSSALSSRKMLSRQLSEASWFLRDTAIILNKCKLFNTQYLCTNKDSSRANCYQPRQSVLLS